MSKSNFLENAYLALLFNATTFNGVAENDTTTPNTSFYLALHTADPTDAGTQDAFELTVAGYSRKAVTRDSGGFTVSGNQVTLTTDNDFTACTGGGPETATHWSVGLASAGATEILYSGTITPNLVVQNGVTPRLTTATQITED